ncbi:serine/arginine repetitive matrix protein 1-like [Neocloeon triangulifer]|uniref:serine/arginine repetitive matrix protein 1-like n=1 Tax=Neocloeon triangulifer TaxID=2078957 RepID=UPI00286FAB1C|nr:serine/arginine repetitive matrix protein 1-like [Neocloeon triangulifer]
MFKKLKNSKKEKTNKKKPAAKKESLEQLPERDASGEQDLPLDETSPANLEPKADKDTLTYDPAEDANNENEDLPPELQMLAVPTYMLGAMERSATFVVLNRERNGNTLSFRLQADIDPEALKRQHRLREEQKLARAKLFENEPPLRPKLHTRVDYMKHHRLKNAGLKNLVVSKSKPTPTPSPRKSPRVRPSPRSLSPKVKSSRSKSPVKLGMKSVSIGKTQNRQSLAKKQASPRKKSVAAPIARKSVTRGAVRKSVAEVQKGKSSPSRARSKSVTSTPRKSKSAPEILKSKKAGSAASTPRASPRKAKISARPSVAQRKPSRIPQSVLRKGLQSKKSASSGGSSKSAGRGNAVKIIQVHLKKR